MLCESFMLRTGLVKHLIALIKDEVLQIGKAEVPVADESVDTAGGTNNKRLYSFLIW